MNYRNNHKDLLIAKSVVPKFGLQNIVQLLHPGLSKNNDVYVKKFIFSFFI